MIIGIKQDVLVVLNNEGINVSKKLVKNQDAIHNVGIKFGLEQSNVIMEKK